METSEAADDQGGCRCTDEECLMETINSLQDTIICLTDTIICSLLVLLQKTMQTAAWGTDPDSSLGEKRTREVSRSRANLLCDFLQIEECPAA